MSVGPARAVTTRRRAARSGGPATRDRVHARGYVPDCQAAPTAHATQALPQHHFRAGEPAATGRPDAGEQLVQAIRGDQPKNNVIATSARSASTTSGGVLARATAMSRLRPPKNGTTTTPNTMRANLLENAFREARLRFGMRIVHYSIQGNHLHLIVEVDDTVSLSRGVQGLAVRIARRLNALIRRRGAVFVDRYHAHALRTRREVAHAVRYVLGNYRHHTREYLPPRWDDPYSSSRFLRAAPKSDAPVMPPRTWLLRIGWRERDLWKPKLEGA